MLAAWEPVFDQVVVTHVHEMEGGFRSMGDDVLAILDRTGPADIETHRCIEFQRVASRCRLGRTIHDADLHADLIDEDDEAARTADRACDLAQRLAHQARLQAGLLAGLAHRRHRPVLTRVDLALGPGPVAVARAVDEGDLELTPAGGAASPPVIATDGDGFLVALRRAGQPDAECGFAAPRRLRC